MLVKENAVTPPVPRLLIVEDEYILAMNLQEGLESLGYAVIDIVDSAEVAIEKAQELRPNLILMDIRLRGKMDGIQAAEQIWTHLQIPIIYVTGHSDKSTVERATLTFPFGYILKPIKEQELYVAIQTALSRYQREQFLSAVLRGMGDGVIVVDTQLRVKYLNSVAEALTGWRLDEVKDRILTEVIKLVDQKTQLPQENSLITALQQETTVYLSDGILLITKEGTTIPIADSATPLRDNNGLITGAVMVFQDDTQRRLIEERNLAAERTRQIEIQMAELKRLNQLKADFLTTTSHEMRTPLSNIKMAIHMLENVLKQQGVLKSETLSASGTIANYLNILREQCERELNLVDDLINMRIIDADAYPLELTSMRLQDWLPEIVQSFQELAQTQQQTLKFSISPDLPSLVSDLHILNRVVLELLNNACKYTPANEQITLNAQLINSIMDENKSAGSYLQIVVSNSGIEISTKELSLIFEPFYRVAKSNYGQNKGNPWQNEGAGMGLAIVKKLVEYLQGKIQAISSQGWTIFTVEIPLVNPSLTLP
jgi:PAS domain S-box-containing protein